MELHYFLLYRPSVSITLPLLFFLHEFSEKELDSSYHGEIKHSSFSVFGYCGGGSGGEGNFETHV